MTERTKYFTFTCPCGKTNTVEEHFYDENDLGDGDSLDFYCECGEYYKKASRIVDKALKYITSEVSK